VDQQWSENYLTAAGRQMHKKTDDPFADEVREGNLFVRSAHLISKELGLYGIADIIEFRQSPGNHNAITLSDRTGFWHPNIVEYKRGEPKISDCDRLQLTAQAMCLEEMHGIKIDAGSIFYGQTRRREQIAIVDKLRESVQNMAIEMHDLFARHAAIPSGKTKSCAACSLYEICRPDVFDKNAKKYIMNLLNEEAA
jgi:CRISPR-associated exonuclease Cas4